jgi:gamma-glutamyl phosphate reductase
MLTTNGLSTTNDETVLARQAKQASLILGALSISERNFALQVIYTILLSKKNEILEANKLDMQVLALITVLKCRRRWS